MLLHRLVCERLFLILDNFNTHFMERGSSTCIGLAHIVSLILSYMLFEAYGSSAGA